MKSQYKLTLFRYLLALLLLLSTQVVFYFLNSHLFNIDGFKEFISICWGNVVFALASLTFYLALFFLLSLAPVPIKNNKVYRLITSILYYIGVEFMLFLNLVDCGYYNFTFRRITFDIFSYLGVGGDFGALIPIFARDYWHIVLIFVILNVILYWTDAKLKKRYYKEELFTTSKKRWYVIESVVFVLAAFALIVFHRGGLQKRVMNPIQASKYARVQNTSLVLNTPYTFYRTIGKKSTFIHNFYKDDELEKIFSPISSPNDNIWTDSLFTEIPSVGKTNIMIIIMESFSAEYSGIYNKEQSFTPFLDSLSKYSIVFQGLANGKKSIDGIPAITASLPLLMENSYITSVYNEDKLNSIAGVLQKKGYSTAFFHGGYNGTMNFDGFALRSGYQKYYGLDEFNNQKYYDGSWGIFDEPFFQFTAKQMGKMKEPFVTTLFSISSHPPFALPDKYKGKFPKGRNEYEETVFYSDHALQAFFDSIKNKPFYKNTLFLIVADHCGVNTMKQYRTDIGMHKIVTMLYSPKLKHGLNTSINLQQIDILPTLMDIIHYPDKVFGYGRSIFSPLDRFFIYYANGEYVLWTKGYISVYKEGENIELYDAKDETLKHNIASKYPDIASRNERLTKAIIQQYSNRIIRNHITLE